MSTPYARQVGCWRLRLVIRSMLPEMLLDHETYETYETHQADEFPAYGSLVIPAQFIIGHSNFNSELRCQHCLARIGLVICGGCAKEAVAAW